MSDRPRLPQLRAVTFDFWGTLYRISDGTELERGRRRIETVFALFGRLASPEDIVHAFDQAVRLKRPPGEPAVGHEERLRLFLSILGAQAGRDQLAEFRRRLVRIALDIPPSPAPGARPCVSRCAGRFELGVVSDTGFTPGEALEQALRRDGFIPPLAAFSWSDETRWAKPDARAFGAALSELGVRPEEAVHVGDLLETDVLGAVRCGMRAIWLRPDAAGAERAPLPQEFEGRAFELRSMEAVPALLDALKDGGA